MERGKNDRVMRDKFRRGLVAALVATASLSGVMDSFPVLEASEPGRVCISNIPFLSVVGLRERVADSAWQVPPDAFAASTAPAFNAPPELQAVPLNQTAVQASATLPPFASPFPTTAPATSAPVATGQAAPAFAMPPVAPAASDASSAFSAPPLYASLLGDAPQATELGSLQSSALPSGSSASASSLAADSAAGRKMDDELTAGQVVLQPVPKNDELASSEAAKEGAKVPAEAPKRPAYVPLRANVSIEPIRPSQPEQPRASVKISSEEPKVLMTIRPTKANLSDKSEAAMLPATAPAPRITPSTDNRLIPASAVIEEAHAPDLYNFGVAAEKQLEQNIAAQYSQPVPSSSQAVVSTKRVEDRPAVPAAKPLSETAPRTSLPSTFAPIPSTIASPRSSAASNTPATLTRPSTAAVPAQSWTPSAPLSQSREPSVVRIKKHTSLASEADTASTESNVAVETKSETLSDESSLYNFDEKSAAPRPPRLGDAPALLDVPTIKPVPESGQNLSLDKPTLGERSLGSEAEQETPKAVIKPAPRKAVTKPSFDFSSLAPKAQVRVARNGTYSVRFSHAIKQVIVQDDSFCQAVVTAANEVSVIGREEGVTRIAIQLLTKDSVETTVLEVSTSAEWETPVSKSAEEIARLNKSVQEMFPNAKVSIVRSNDGAVSVSGFVEDEAMARNILSLVRRICLVPVKDLVVVKAP